MTIVIQGAVTGQTLSVKAANILSGTIAYVDMQFVFSAEWRGLRKWVHLQLGDDGEIYSVELGPDGRLPEGVTFNPDAGDWAVWLHGESFEGEEVVTRIVTETRYFRVDESAAIEGEVFPDVDIPAAERIIARAVAAQHGAEAALVELDRRLNSGEVQRGLIAGPGIILLPDGTIKVNATNEVAEDNTLPVTSAGVSVVVGNINALLETI